MNTVGHMDGVVQMICRLDSCIYVMNIIVAITILPVSPLALQQCNSKALRQASHVAVFAQRRHHEQEEEDHCSNAGIGFFNTISTMLRCRNVERL